MNTAHDYEEWTLQRQVMAMWRNDEQDVMTYDANTSEVYILM